MYSIHRIFRVLVYWVTVHKNREPFKGTVKTPSIGSGRGFCLQTVHLESQR